MCLENSTFIPTDLGEDGTPTVVFRDDDWLTPNEREFKTRALTRQDTIRTIYEPPDADSTTVSPTPAAPSPVLPRVARVAPKVSTPAIIPAPPSVQRESISADLPPPTAPEPVLPSIADAPSGVRRSTRSTKGVLQQTRYIDEAYLSSLNLSDDQGGHQAQSVYLPELFTCPDSGVLDIGDRRVYSAKLRENDADNPTFQHAMHGPYAAEYIKAMVLEIHTLVGQRT